MVRSLSLHYRNTVWSPLWMSIFRKVEQNQYESSFVHMILLFVTIVLTLQQIFQALLDYCTSCNFSVTGITHRFEWLLVNAWLHPVNRPLANSPRNLAIPSNIEASRYLTKCCAQNAESSTVYLGLNTHLEYSWTITDNSQALHISICSPKYSVALFSILRAAIVHTVSVQLQCRGLWLSDVRGRDVSILGG